MAECDEVRTVGNGGDCEGKTVEKSPFKNLNRATGYPISEAELAFTKAPILRHFDPKCHIRIETDGLGYVIGGVLNQLTLDNLA